MQNEMKDPVLQKIREISMKYKVQKAVLFGSRARGDHSPVSDYDIAITGEELSDFDKACLCADVEEIDTLKKIDILFVDVGIKDDLMKNIARDGVTLYEQIGE